MPQARLVVLSAAPETTRVLHNVEASPRTPTEVWRELAGARAFVSGGGSLVQDVTSVRSAMYYLATMRAAEWRRVPVAVVGQGIGPIRRAWIRRLAARAYSQARVVSVRDADSQRMLEWLGVTRDVHLGADLALLAPPAEPEGVKARLRAEGLSLGQVRIGVAVRAWPGMRDPIELGKGIGRFAEMFGGRIAVFPFDPSHDGEVSRIVAEAAVGRVVAAESPQDLMGLVGAMDIMVGVRLHGLIFAAAQAVPSVALAYDPKVTAFMAEVGLPAVLPVDSTGLAVAEALARTWDGRVALRSRLRAAIAGLRARAEAGVDRVAALLAGSGPRGAPVLPAEGVPRDRTE